MAQWIQQGKGAVQKVVLLFWRMDEEERFMDLVLEVYAYDETAPGLVKRIGESVRIHLFALVMSNMISEILFDRRNSGLEWSKM